MARLDGWWWAAEVKCLWLFAAVPLHVRAILQSLSDGVDAGVNCR